MSYKLSDIFKTNKLIYILSTRFKNKEEHVET